MRRTFAVLLVLAPAAACGFPDVSYETSTDAGKDRNGGSSSGSSSGSGDDSSSSSGGVDAQGDARMNVDGNSSGDGPETDGAGNDAPQDTYVAPIDAPPDSPLCDRDGDGFNGPQCAGGTDCCDFDLLAFPGQPMFFGSEDACHSWDFNCDGMVTERYSNSLMCGGNPALGGCTGGSGFTTPGESCGQTGPLYTCGGTSLTTCGPITPVSTQQVCH